MGKGQKRSPNTYQKINTVFYRDENNIIMPFEELCTPELQWLRENNIKLYATEKVDGTNCRIEVTMDDIIHSRDMAGENDYGKWEDGVCFNVEYKGKTDNANMPKTLQKVFDEKYPKEKVLSALGLKSFIPFSEFADHNWVDKDNEGNVTGINIDKVPKIWTIYGEGYGEGIQKGGRYLKGKNDFIVFDVKVNEIWLQPENVKEIASKLDAQYVPEYGPMTIDEAMNVCRFMDWKSQIAEDKTLPIEGIVLKTPLGFLDRMGRRIICKIKVEDFKKYYNKYGTHQQVPQNKNPKANY